MDKIEFNKLEILQQIEFINSQLLDGESLRSISSNLKMSKTTFRDRALIIGYTYNKNLGRYDKETSISMQLHQSNTKEPHKARERATNTIQEGDTKKLQKYDNDLKELLNNKDEIMEMLRNYKSNVIGLEQLNINSLPLNMQYNIVNKSIKIYNPVYKLFDEVCNQNTNYKKQDLISLALLEFCNKYKQ